MKTVKEIAFDLDVSQVTVYNHIKKLDKELKGNIFKKQGVTYLDDEGIKQLKISMGLIQVPVVKENVGIEEIISDISKQVSITIKEELRTEIRKELQEELEKQKDLIIDQITQKHLQQIQSENNKLKDYIMAAREEENKRGFFSRLFNR